MVTYFLHCLEKLDEQDLFAYAVICTGTCNFVIFFFFLQKPPSIALCGPGFVKIRFVLNCITVSSGNVKKKRSLEISTLASLVFLVTLN